MFIWIVILVLFVATAIGVVLDPRRLRNGVLLLAALSLTGLALIAFVLNKLSSPTNEAAAWFLLGILAVGMMTVLALAAFLVYTGGVMLAKEARRLPNLLSLLLGIALFAYVTLGVLAVILDSQSLVIWIFFSIPPIGYLGFVFTSFLVYAWLYGVWARRFGGPVTTVIVLGAGLAGDRVTPLLASRLALGQKVYETSRTLGYAPVLIPSGGQGRDEAISEAGAMSAWLLANGVPEKDVVKEDRSTSTEENLRYSMVLREERDIGGKTAVVTNDFHAFRAATLMSRLGIPGYAIGSATARYYWPTATIREFVALLRDHLRLNALILGVLTIPLLAFLFASLLR